MSEANQSDLPWIWARAEWPEFRWEASALADGAARAREEARLARLEALARGRAQEVEDAREASLCCLAAQIVRPHHPEAARRLEGVGRAYLAERGEAGLGAGALVQMGLIRSFPWLAERLRQRLSGTP